MDEKGAAPGPYRLLLQPSGRSVVAAADRPLLATALDAGIEWANSCRNGTCRACLRPLHAGVVEYLIPWPGLLPEERTGAWVLPCVAYPRSDLVLGD